MAGLAAFRGSQVHAASVRLADGRSFHTLAEAVAALDRNDGVADLVEIHAARIEEFESTVLAGNDPLILRGVAQGGRPPVVLVKNDTALFVFDPPQRAATEWKIENLIVIPCPSVPHRGNSPLEYRIKREIDGVVIELNHVVFTAATRDGKPVEASGAADAGVRWRHLLTPSGLVGGAGNVLRFRNSGLFHFSETLLSLSNFGVGDFRFEFHGGAMAHADGILRDRTSRDYTVSFEAITVSHLRGSGISAANLRGPVTLRFGPGTRMHDIHGPVVSASRFRGAGTGVKLEIAGAADSPASFERTGGFSLNVELVGGLDIKHAVFLGSHRPALRFGREAEGAFHLAESRFEGNLVAIGLESGNVSGRVEKSRFVDSAVGDAVFADWLGVQEHQIAFSDSDIAGREEDVSDYRRGAALNPPEMSEDPYGQSAVDRAHHALMVTLDQVRYWEAMGYDTYARRAAWEIRGMLQAFEDGKWRDASQFVPTPFMYSVRALHRGGFLNDADFAVAQNVMERKYAGRGLGGYHADDNQIPSIAVGMAIAAKVFSDSPRAKDFQRFAEAAWDVWYEPNRDTTENSTGYNVIFLRHVLELAEELGKEQELRTPEVRDMFVRFRDMVTPGGDMPDFGQGAVGHGGYGPIFERAAALYQDGTFRWAARRLFEKHGADALAAQRWADESIEPRVPHAKSQVTLRREPVPLAPAGGRDAFTSFDKMILRAPSPGAPGSFVMVELYNQGGKTSPQQIQPVIHYEVGGHLLLSGSRRSFAAPEANLLLVGRHFDGFPDQAALHARPEAGQWQTARIYPEQAMGAGGGESAGCIQNYPKRYIDRLLFRGEADIVIAKLRLEGAAGSLPIDEELWRTTAGWPRSAAAALADDAGGDAKALRLRVGGRAGIVKRIEPPVEFDLREYPYIAFDWKLAAPADSVPTLQFTGHKPFSLTELQNAAHPARAAVADLPDGSAYGETATGKNYFTPGTSASRQLYLDASSRILAVVDELRPGEDAVGMTTGPIWNLLEEAKQIAPNAVATVTGPKRLLIWSAPAADREAGISGRRAFARQRIADTEPLRFVTVLVPLNPEDDPAAMAGTISIRDGKGAVQIRVELPDGSERRLELPSVGAQRIDENTPEIQGSSSR